MNVKLSILAAMIGLTLTAGPAYLKLPDGRVLRNPYLLDQTPTSVTIGHDDGALSVPIKNLSQELRKELGYDPREAAANQALLNQTRKQEATANAEANAEVRAIDNAAKAIDNKQQLNARIQELEKQLREAKAKNKAAAAPATTPKPEVKAQLTPEVDKDSFSSVYGDSVGSRAIHRYKNCRSL